MKQVSTGGLSFQEIRRRGKFYVDKTLLIKDMLDADDGGVFLYTRPRRFGKTTNVTMLNAFFNIDLRETIGSMGWTSTNVQNAIGTRTRIL